MDEFELIESFFAKATKKNGVIVDIGDDAAVVRPSSGYDLVFAADALVENYHFDSSISAFDLGHKALAVNLSDMAAMGAIPRWFSLSIGLDIANEQWLGQFVNGMAQLANRFNCALVGGDTVSSDKKFISISVIGEIEQGKALTRSGAKDGDLVILGGPIGLAQQVWRNLSAASDEARDAFYRPEPQIELGRSLINYANSCIDVSDGLLSELNHISKASGLRLNIELSDIPFGTTSNRSQQELELALTGGEDYVLLFSISPDNWVNYSADYKNLATICTQIGYCGLGDGVILRQDGIMKEVIQQGFKHF